MTGRIEAIYYAAAKGQPQTALDAAQLLVGRGLQGDRHFERGGGVVSLIEAEAVAAFNAATGLNIEAAESRRNIVTTGVSLNPLVGQRFYLGDIELEGFELCEPCASLGQRLANQAVSAAAVVRAFVDSAGIRAYVRGTGVIRPGTTIRMASSNR